MKKSILIRISILATFLTISLTIAQANQPPEVRNGHVQQRPGEQLVDITFDLIDQDGDLLTVEVEASDDNGETWNVQPKTLSGDVGENIQPGNGKNIVWDVGNDLPSVKNPNFKVRLIVDDGYVPSEEEEIIWEKDGARMRLIPAGEFEMGDHDHFNEDWNNDELPVHTVYVDAFYMDVYEVTNEKYAKFLNDYGENEDSEGHELLDLDDDDCLIEESGGVYRPMSGYENHPVIEVSWYGANAYAEYYGKRLPTEAEWEKAARGGLVGKRYPWGNDADPTKANYDHDGTRDWSTEDMPKYLKPVGSFPPNGYGLYDMAGNIWEWCNDWYGSNYYSSSPYANPRGPSTGSFRLLRGGSWDSYAYFMRVAMRYYDVPYFTTNNNVFRCCVSQDVTP